MCGIIAYAGHRPAVPLLVEGLKRLEYRGYDSSGVAFLDSTIKVIRKPGKMLELEKALESAGNVMNASCGIGHTRWATHGVPNEINAHPHKDNSGRFALIHNGIIENFQEFKDELTELGYTFQSETDTEVLVNLISEGMKREGGNIEKGLSWALRRSEAHMPSA